MYNSTILSRRALPRAAKTARRSRDAWHLDRLRAAAHTSPAASANTRSLGGQAAHQIIREVHDMPFGQRYNVYKVQILPYIVPSAFTSFQSNVSAWSLRMLTPRSEQAAITHAMLRQYPPYPAEDASPTVPARPAPPSAYYLCSDVSLASTA